MPSRPLTRFAWIPGALVALTLLVPHVQAAMIGAGPGSGPRSVAIRDLNEDGYSDLIWGNWQDSTLCVALGRGNGRFQPRVAYACGSIVYGMDVADLNGDGHLDVVDCCANINKVQVRFGAGDGTLGPRTDYAVSVPLDVVARDLNEDGWPDLAISAQSAPDLKILMATGPGTYGPLVEYAGQNALELAVGDLNNDGDLDIVTGNVSSSGFNVYLSTGGPGLYGIPVTYTTQGGGTSVVLVDLNHDGALDVVVANSGFKCLNVRLGIGNGTFGPNTVTPLDGEAFSATSGDFNGDTHPDIAVGVYGANEVSVFLGTGTGTFQPKVDYPGGLNPMRLAAGPLDGDGNADLAVAAWGSNSICTLPGNGDGTFQIPSGPVYVWAPASGTAFDPNAWLPPRNASSAADILVFNRGGVVSVSSVPTATIGQLVFSGGTEASFSGLFGATTLTVAGGAGDDAVVEEGSKAVLNSASSPVSVNLAFGAHSTIYGDIEIRGGNSKFQAVDPSGILFQSTGRAIIGPGSSTTPFGNGTGASGDRSVRFLYGSVYIAQTPVAVWGTTPFPSEVVTLGQGSRLRMDVAFNQDVSERRMGSLEYNAPAASALTGSGTFLCDSLIVNQGTLSVEVANNISIRGNIVLPSCSGPFALRFMPPVPAEYYFEGDGRQYVYSKNPDCSPTAVIRMYSSSNVTWNINNDAVVDFIGFWRTVSNIHFRHGNIGSSIGWQAVPDSSSIVTNASQATGWFETGLARRISADGPMRFDLGDSAHYLPFDVVVRGVNKPGYITAGNYAWEHEDFQNAQLDPAHFVHRTPFLHATSTAGNVGVPTYFTDLDATFSFLPSDVDPGSDPLQFEARGFYWWDVPWSATTHGVRTATSFQVLGVTPSYSDSFETYAIGLPITPSLSVTNASSPEGNGPGAVAPTSEAVIAHTVPSAPVELKDADGMPIAPVRRVRERAQAAATASQPARAQSAGSLAFRVRLSQPAIVPISVDYQTVDGTATVADGDYTPTSGTLTFAPRDTALDIVVPFGVDARPEHNETFGITLSNASNATIDTPSATGTIVDDDDLIAPTAHVVYPNGGEVIHQNQQVALQWTASDNLGVNGVDIQLVNGASVTTLASNYPNTGSYSWLSTGPASTKMKFRVVAHDDNHATIDNSDANWEISIYTIGVEDEVPVAFALSPPAPNPSPAGLNRIAFAVPREAHVRVTVHDVRGRTLAKLADGILPAGNHVRMWDASGLGAGVYFVRFEAPGFHADQRLVVVK